MEEVGVKESGLLEERESGGDQESKASGERNAVKGREEKETSSSDSDEERESSGDHINATGDTESSLVGDQEPSITHQEITSVGEDNDNSNTNTASSSSSSSSSVGKENVGEDDERESSAEATEERNAPVEAETTASDSDHLQERESSSGDHINAAGERESSLVGDQETSITQENSRAGENQAGTMMRPPQEREIIEELMPLILVQDQTQNEEEEEVGRNEGERDIESQLGEEGEEMEPFCRRQDLLTFVTAALISFLLTIYQIFFMVDLF